MSSPTEQREQMNLVIVGHVDHGKSTIIGRLMADTGSLPKGKLEQVKRSCEMNSRPFEYAFLLDALKDEQAQGITIDTARCFFKTAKRDYIINDAPGHVEFLKNMITGAARAQAALLVIDALEGIRENSKRHGYILSMLGIRQVAVLVNKMDLVAYKQEVFERISREYTAFLDNLGVTPRRFIPVSARQGVNITTIGRETPWYNGMHVLAQVDDFSSHTDDHDRPFRMPVQDIYKFTEAGDDRRIIAGTILSGSVRIGDEVKFYPSGKCSQVRSVENFNSPTTTTATAGQARGFTLTTQIYVRPGELLCRAHDEQPETAARFRANIFWMGRSPLVKGRRCKLKIGAMRVPVELVGINSILDASELTTVKNKEQVDRHDVAEVFLETTRPIAFDRSSVLEKTSRFVIVDEYEIAGCGIVLEPDTRGSSILESRVRKREFNWNRGAISRDLRIAGYGHCGKFIVFVANHAQTERAENLAKELERRLFATGKHTYYLAISNVFDDLSRGDTDDMTREEHLLQLGELARIMTDSGLLFITTLAYADDHDVAKLKILNQPNSIFVVEVGECDLSEHRMDLSVPCNQLQEEALTSIIRELNRQDVIPDYCI